MTKTKRGNKSKCTEDVETRSERDSVSIQVRNIGGSVMVTTEENSIREEFGSVDTDEYSNC